jgi:hypothetical protein
VKSGYAARSGKCVHKRRFVEGRHAVPCSVSGFRGCEQVGEGVCHGQRNAMVGAASQLSIVFKVGAPLQMVVAMQNHDEVRGSHSIS